MKKFLYLIFIFSFTNAYSQTIDSVGARYGVFGDVNLNFHRADFKKLPGVPNCCSTFDDGSGTSFSAGILYEKNLYKSLFWGARLGYNNFSGLLTKKDNTVVIKNDVLQEATFEHRIDAKLAAIELNPYINVALSKYFLFNIGFDIDLLMTKTYNQSETLLGGGTFVDENGVDTKKAVRNVFSGDIPDANSIGVGLNFGLSYEFPLNKHRTTTISPEFIYHVNISPIVKDLTWSYNQVKLGAAVKYSPDRIVPTEYKFERQEIIDTVKVEKDGYIAKAVVPGKAKIISDSTKRQGEVLISEQYFRTDTLFVKKPPVNVVKTEIRAVGVDTNSVEIENPNIRIEEFVSNKLQPLLNYVFFDENKSDLSQRYIRKTPEEMAKFDESKFFLKSTMDTYYELLNIVGSRMAANPKATLKITGTNDSHSSEKDNTNLAKERAETVANYLIYAWKIDPKRLTVEKRGLPDKKSTPEDDPIKMQENRRVELFSKEYEILKPVYSGDTIRNANPISIRFKFNSFATVGIKNAEIKVWQKDRIIKSIKMTEDFSGQYDWNLQNDQAAMPRFGEPLYYTITVTDKENKVVESEKKSILVSVETVEEKRKNRKQDKIIDNYSLILFNFSDDKIDGNNQKIINLIKKNISPKSEISISGYTDQTGGKDYNISLSKRRAESAKKALKLDNATTDGFGGERLLYTNDLPEGRFFCRTVNIHVETLVNDGIEGK